MRIFCFSTFRQLSPDQHLLDIKPYDINANERKAKGYYPPNTIENAFNYSGTLNECQLTEIIIGYQIRGSNKFYFMIIYRKDTETIKIPMVRGAVLFKILPSKSYDFVIATSKIFSEISFDVCINIYCIRNTTLRSVITQEEEKIYESYAHQINLFCHKNHCLKETALGMLPPFKLPNTTTEKVYKQKIQYIQELVTLLCHPKIGSFQNIKDNSRIDQHLSCFLAKRDCWNAPVIFDSTATRQAGLYRGCRKIKWEKADAKYLQNVEAELESIDFKNMINIFDSANTISTFFKHINFAHLVELSLVACRIPALSDEFLQLLPPNLLLLNLDENDITYISKNISKLQNLQILSLESNKNLGDSGVPWSFLPSNITMLKLRFTNISKLPAEIKRLIKLEMLGVISEKLEYVSWENISTSIKELHVQGNCGYFNEFNVSDKKKLKCFGAVNAGIIAIDSKLPASIERLVLNDNKLTHFDSKCLRNLQNLKLRNNSLKSIAWENLPSSLWHLYLDHNELTCIENVQHLTELRCLELHFNQIQEISNEICNLQKLSRVFLNDNQLSSLPVGFENLNNVLLLHLQSNNFNYADGDLMKTLWERIPRSVEELDLSYNSLHKIPCLLRNINIRYLLVLDCNLEDICPYIVTQKAKTLQRVGIANNPKIQNLPFIPLVDGKYNRLTVYTDSIEIMTSGRKKIAYTFKTCEEERGTECCKCCAKCGQQTDKKKIEQMMLMDFKIQKWEKGWRLYKPEEWKTKVVTNLCQSCIDLYKQSGNKAQTTNSRMVRKRKPTTSINVEFIHRPLMQSDNFNRAVFNDSLYTNPFQNRLHSTSNDLPLPYNSWHLNNSQHVNDKVYDYQRYNRHLPPHYSMNSSSLNAYSPMHSTPIISLTTMAPNSSHATRYHINSQEWLSEASGSAQNQSSFSYQYPIYGDPEAMLIDDVDSEVTQIQNYFPIQATQSNILETAQTQHPQNDLLFDEAMEVEESNDISLSNNGQNKLPPIEAFMDKPGTSATNEFKFHRL